MIFQECRAMCKVWRPLLERFAVLYSILHYTVLCACVVLHGIAVQWRQRPRHKRIGGHAAANQHTLPPIDGRQRAVQYTTP